MASIAVQVGTQVSQLYTPKPSQGVCYYIVLGTERFFVGRVCELCGHLSQQRIAHADDMGKTMFAPPNNTYCSKRHATTSWLGSKPLTTAAKMQA